jgi:hypothetical protein
VQVLFLRYGPAFQTLSPTVGNFIRRLIFHYSC